MRIWAILFFCLLSGPLAGQRINAVTADALMQRTSHTDTVYIINFWATWCGPCVRELPVFDALAKQYQAQPVKILLVSLDFKDDVAKKLPQFVARKRLLPEVLWLSETNANVFIPKIAPSWEGAIPATLIRNPQKSFQRFIEGMITEGQIIDIVNHQLQ